MEYAFWEEAWKSEKPGFHEDEANVLLTRYFDRTALAADSHIFVPLCGKSHDLSWLLKQGHRVTGIELMEKAVIQLFDHLDITPEISDAGKLRRFGAGPLTVYAGDIFDLDAVDLGTVDLIYDRGALVALPQDMRRRYAAHIQVVTSNALQYLISYDYDQNEYAGPPFAISEGELAACYGRAYAVERLASVAVEGGFAGDIDIKEQVILLRPSS